VTKEKKEKRWAKKATETNHQEATTTTPTSYAVQRTSTGISRRTSNDNPDDSINTITDVSRGDTAEAGNATGVSSFYG